MSGGTPMDVDVVVVGGGLAGLAAARVLAASGRSVVVLEARDRVGGRTWTVPLDEDGFIDLGGQWTGPGQDRLAALADELGIEQFPTYDGGEPTFAIGGQSSIDLDEVVEAMREIDRMASTIDPERPWDAPSAAAWDAQTLASWLEPRVKDPAAVSLMRLASTAIFTMEPAELSLLHVLVYVRAAGSMWDLTTGAQRRRFVGGAQQLSTRMAESLGADRVLLERPVHRIEQEGGRALVWSDDLRLLARRVIVAAPITLVDRIEFRPPLPSDRAQLQQRVAPGATSKVHCVYDRPFWRDQGQSGYGISDVGLVSVTYDNSPPSGLPGVLVAFVEADNARSFAMLDDHERRSAVEEDLVRLFGPQARAIRCYVEQQWSDEEWTRGCYGSNFAPGAWTRYGPALRPPCGLVHWAGAETSPVWMNYMEGAVRSGERAAAEVDAALAGGPDQRRP